MLIALALMMQTASLDADPAKAALSCAMATAVADASQGPMRVTSQVSHFVMQAAKADPGTKPFLDRVGELTEQAGSGTRTAEFAKAVMPECDRRFPLARSTAAVRLPGDAFDRDVMCFGVIALLKGAATQFEEDGGDAGPLDKLETAFAPISDRLTDEALRARGINSEAAFTVAMGNQLKASLVLGNAESVARACGVAPY